MAAKSVAPAFKIKELRLVVSDSCPYSCRYCNLYYKKLLATHKISQSSFAKKYKIGNESFSLLFDQKGPIFKLTDYRFLFFVLRSYFGLEDVTFTGGDPFLNPDLVKIINSAHKLGIKTTAITKGAPLFNLKDRKGVKKKLGNLDRIIISLDTLDATKYANNNLPFLKTEKGKMFLPQTLKLIKFLGGINYNLEINSVIGILPSTKQKLNLLFKEVEQIIDFCLNNNVKKIKFLELDSNKTLGRPYIEKFFRLLIGAGNLKKYGIKSSDFKIDPKMIKLGMTKICCLKSPFKKSEGLEIIAYRTHCPLSFLLKENNKKCEFKKGGELHLDLRGKSFLCQRDNNFNYFDIYPFVKSRDQEGLITCFTKIERAIRKQKCKF